MHKQSKKNNLKLQTDTSIPFILYRLYTSITQTCLRHAPTLYYLQRPFAPNTNLLGIGRISGRDKIRKCKLIRHLGLGQDRVL